MGISFPKFLKGMRTFPCEKMTKQNSKTATHASLSLIQLHVNNYQLLNTTFLYQILSLFNHRVTMLIIIYGQTILVWSLYICKYIILLTRTHIYYHTKGYMWWRRMDVYKPALGMIGLQFTYAGVALFTRAALLQGLSPRVFVVYRQGIATLVIVPIAYFSRR